VVCLDRGTEVFQWTVVVDTRGNKVVMGMNTLQYAWVMESLGWCDKGLTDSYVFLYAS
jgi:hypothetical protein